MRKRKKNCLREHHELVGLLRQYAKIKRALDESVQVRIILEAE